MITVTKRSKELVENIFDKEFDKYKNQWEQQSAIEVLRAAREFGLNDWANKRENDL